MWEASVREGDECRAELAQYASGDDLCPILRPDTSHELFHGGSWSRVVDGALAAVARRCEICVRWVASSSEHELMNLGEHLSHSLVLGVDRQNVLVVVHLQVYCVAYLLRRGPKRLG